MRAPALARHGLAVALCAVVVLGAIAGARWGDEADVAEVMSTSSFVAALASGDPGEVERAEGMAEPGSPARAFVELVSETVGRLTAQDVVIPRPAAPTRSPGGSLASCTDGSACTSFDSFVTGAQGRIQTFRIDGRWLEELLDQIGRLPAGDERNEERAGGVEEPTSSTTLIDPPATTSVPPTTPTPPTTTTAPPVTAAPTTTPTTTTPTTTSAPPTTRPPATVPPATTPPATTPRPSPPTNPSGRDLALWPFSSSSPWNLPVGSAARYDGASSPLTAQLRSTALPSKDRTLAVPIVSWVNSSTYSVPVYRARASDREVRLVDDLHGEETRIRVPAGALPAEGTDSNMAIIQPDGRTVDIWNAHWVGTDTIDSLRFESTRLDGQGIGPQAGIRASGVSSIGGLIRRWEVDPSDPAHTDGVIRHALAMAVPGEMLHYATGDPGYDAAGYGTSKGYVWPATEQDWDAPWTYSGAIPMGSMVAIPRSVELDSLGLTPEARALAQALQDYGAYVVDRTGGGTVTFYAEPTVPSAWTTAVTGPAWSGQQLTLLRSLLTVVGNSGPASAGGGGDRPLGLAP